MNGIAYFLCLLFAMHLETQLILITDLSYNNAKFFPFLEGWTEGGFCVLVLRALILGLH